MRASPTHCRLLVLVAIIATVAACARRPSVARGTWPDGRIEAPSRVRMLPPPPAPPKVVEPAEEEWTAAAPDANGLSAAELNRMGVLETVHFAFDSAAIGADQRRVIEDNARWLREHPGVTILVEGHCDERGTREYNLALGTRRADSVRQALVAAGIAPERIETVSYGEELPADPGHGEAAWARNRRGELVILSTDS